jgi:TetR/AcrR family transcriptional repressor of mexJK operon
VSYLTSPDIVSFYSVLAGDLRRHPELAKAFYDLGPGVTHGNLSAIIAAARDRDEVSADNPVAAAEQLIGLWLGLLNYRLSLGIDAAFPDTRTAARVESAVDVFLAAYAVRPPPIRRKPKT